MTMKRNTYRLTSLLLLTVLLAGCTIEVSDEIGDNGGLVPIYLTAEVADAGNGGSATRAGTDIQSTQLASGETFTVEFSSNTTVASTTYQANGSGGTTCTGTQPYFTLDGSSTTAYGYYPSKPGSTFSVQTAQNTDANYKSSDLMYASVNITKSNGAGSGTLTFSHKMAKIIVSATATSGVSQIKDVRIIGGSRTINVTNTTDCTLGTTLTDANSTSSYITMYSGGTATTASCAALIPPQTVSGNFLQIVTDKGTVTYSLSNKAFASGQSYTFNITVNLAAVGTTVAITNWSNNGNATVNPTVVNEVYRQAVDLGLPSGTKWANMNVGASSPTDYGLYFMWGDVAGHPGAISSGTTAADGYNFGWSTYKWTTDGGSSFTKYTGSDYAVLQSADDAATACWGSPWRMPTETEMEELVNNTDQEWTTINSVAGRKFMKKSDHDVYIFLPAAGSRGLASFYGRGSYGLYWSSSLDTGYPSRAWSLYFNSRGANVYYDNRCYGFTVRAVQSN